MVWVLWFLKASHATWAMVLPSAPDDGRVFGLGWVG